MSQSTRAPARAGLDGRADLRSDVHAGTRTFVVGSRQVRPNLPSARCPFCPGGLEAPEPYDGRWFPNRWPAMPDGRCEMVLYTPEHDTTFWSLGVHFNSWALMAYGSGNPAVADDSVALK